MTHRLVSIVIVSVLILSAFMGPIGTVTAQEKTSNTTANGDSTDNESDGNLTAGQQLGVVIQTQSSDITGEFETARFKQELENSANRTVTTQNRAEELQSDISTLRTERKHLIEEFRTGNISKDEFLARLSTVNHRLDKKNELTTEAEIESRSYGANADALQRLRVTSENRTGTEISQIAQDIVKTGETNEGVHADKSGNVYFTNSEGDIVGLDFRVTGNENIGFELVRENEIVGVSVQTETGKPVTNASVTVNSREVGTTNSDGELSIRLPVSTVQDNESNPVSIVVDTGENVSEITVNARDIPNTKAVQAFHKEHSNRSEAKHNTFHDKWEKRHNQFHERTNEPMLPQMNFTESPNQLDDHSPPVVETSIHKKFHQMMERQHNRFHGHIKPQSLSTPAEINKTAKGTGRPADGDPLPDNKPNPDWNQGRSDKGEVQDSLDIGFGLTDSQLTVSVYSRGESVENATVIANGETIGKTNTNGQIVFKPSAEAQSQGEVTVEVQSSDAEAKITIQLGSTETSEGKSGLPETR